MIKKKILNKLKKKIKKLSETRKILKIIHIKLEISLKISKISKNLITFIG